MMANETACSKVLAVTSGKGGVGKTNIASNLSICFAANNKKVVLFDADLGLGNVDVIINADSNYNLTHVLSGYKTLEEIISIAPGGVETICGGSGAGPDFHGCDAVHTHMTNSRLTDPEVLEWRFPVHLEDFRIRTGSGGNGAHHGGNGVTRRVRFLQPMVATILSGHRRIAPYGMAGGEPGKLGRNYVERVDKTVDELLGADRTEMAVGDVFVIETPGGGGYGKP